MRIIAFSDSHGNHSVLVDILLRHKDDADYFIHLGDGERELLQLADEFPEKKIIGVRGNCDWSSASKTTDLIEVMKKRVLFTHGHMHYVKLNLDVLIDCAKNYGADIALFGHTHSALCEHINGIYFINPGSVSLPRNGKSPSYAIIDITKAGIAPHIVYL